MSSKRWCLYGRFIFVVVFVFSTDSREWGSLDFVWLLKYDRTSRQVTDWWHVCCCCCWFLPNCDQEHTDEHRETSTRRGGPAAATSATTTTTTMKRRRSPNGERNFVRMNRWSNTKQIFVCYSLLSLRADFSRSDAVRRRRMCQRNRTKKKIIRLLRLSCYVCLSVGRCVRLCCVLI